jgi:hypothetical protein
MDGEPNPVAEATVRPLFALPAWPAGLINAVPSAVLAYVSMALVAEGRRALAVAWCCHGAHRRVA